MTKVIKLILLSSLTIFVVGCAQQPHDATYYKIKKLESKKNLDEMDKLELEDLRALSQSNQSRLKTNEMLNYCPNK